MMPWWAGIAFMIAAIALAPVAIWAIARFEDWLANKMGWQCEAPDSSRDFPANLTRLTTSSTSRDPKSR